MDDFPAGQASPGPRRPRLSVVVPVHNGGQDLERCLRRLRDTPEPDYELIVVDDGSTDASARVAESFGARVIRHERPLGPAAARNTGAHAALASIVFFLDADVAVHRDTMARALARFDADPSLSALFGSYDDRPEARGIVSQYRNLLHHFVHQRGRFEDDVRSVRTFWTGCGAIRRDVFLQSGGFDPGLYRRPAIEDIELGYRVTRAGGTILLARDVKATHLKRWTFAGMVRTDVFQRGIPWMLLIRRSKIDETDLNVDRAGRLSVAATGVGIIAAIGATFSRSSGLIALLCLVAIILLNRDFYNFLRRTKGQVFTAACLPLHLVYFVCCGTSVVIAMVLWHGWLAGADARMTGEARARGMRLDDPARPAPSRPKSVTTRARRSIRWRR